MTLYLCLSNSLNVQLTSFFFSEQPQPQGGFFGKGLPSNMMGALRQDEDGEPDGFPMASSQGEVVAMPIMDSSNAFGSTPQNDPNVGTGVPAFRGGAPVQRFKKKSSTLNKKH